MTRIYLNYCRELGIQPTDSLRLVFTRGWHAGYEAGQQNERALCGGIAHQHARDAQEAQGAEMTTLLPKKPEPDVSYEAGRDSRELRYAHSDDQLDAYVSECLEAAANLCEDIGVANQALEGSYSAGKKAGAFACLEAIRSLAASGRQE